MANELDIYKEALELLSNQCCECPGTWFGAYDADSELDDEAPSLCECVNTDCDSTNTQACWRKWALAKARKILEGKPMPTTPEMNNKIVELLRVSDNTTCLYAADRIEELEVQIAELTGNAYKAERQRRQMKPS